MQTWKFGDWVGVIGLIIGLLGMMLSYVFWRKSRKECVPRARVGVHRLIGPYDAKSPLSTTDGRLKLVYGEDAVTNASKVFIAVWNSGRDTLKEGAALEEYPLMMILPEGSRVLGEPRVLTQTRSSIRFKATADEQAQNQVRFEFLFLDPDDGALIEVLCGGPAEPLKVVGDFQGSKKIRFDELLQLEPDLPLSERWLNALRSVASQFSPGIVPALLVLGVVTSLISWRDNGLWGALYLVLLVPGVAWAFMFVLIPLLAARPLRSLSALLQPKVRALPSPLRYIPVGYSSQRHGLIAFAVEYWRTYRAALGTDT